MDQYCVFGNPISQSKSPFIHRLFAEQTMQSIRYETHCSEEASFEDDLRHFFAQGGKGCNVTAPFKERAYQFADRLSERAKLAGSVNTLKCLDDNIIIGDNTDGMGLIRDLQRFHIDLSDKKVLILGAGGATKGILPSLLDCKPSEMVIANRSKDKAVMLGSSYSQYQNTLVKGIGLDELVEDSSYDVIINATSSQLSNTALDLPSSILHSDSICYDLNYGMGETAFMTWAKSHGLYRVFDGLGMLVEQASESFMLWRGIKPGTNQVLRELRKNLSI